MLDYAKLGNTEIYAAFAIYAATERKEANEETGRFLVQAGNTLLCNHDYSLGKFIYVRICANPALLYSEIVQY